MYRDYENPRRLEDKLRVTRKAYESMKDHLDDEQKELWMEEIHDLENRVKFAWQDEEADDDDF